MVVDAPRLSSGQCMAPVRDAISLPPGVPHFIWSRAMTAAARAAGLLSHCPVNPLLPMTTVGTCSDPLPIQIGGLP